MEFQPREIRNNRMERKAESLRGREIQGYAHEVRDTYMSASILGSLIEKKRQMPETAMFTMIEGVSVEPGKPPRKMGVNLEQMETIINGMAAQALQDMEGILPEPEIIEAVESITEYRRKLFAPPTHEG